MPALPASYNIDSSASAITVRNLQSRRSLTSTLSHTFRSLFSRALKPRQQNAGGILAIPTQYQGLNSGPTPGAVVGIVLGSIAGFLLLIFLLYIASNGTAFIRGGIVAEEEDIVISTNTRRRSARSPRSHRSRRTEMVSRSPPRRERDRIIRTERIVRRPSMPPPLPRERDRSRFRETIIVEEDASLPLPEERRVPGDDTIEVLEDGDSYVDLPPPRRKSRRGSGYR